MVLLVSLTGERIVVAPDAARGIGAEPSIGALASSEYADESDSLEADATCCCAGLATRDDVVGDAVSVARLDERSGRGGASLRGAPRPETERVDATLGLYPRAGLGTDAPLWPDCVRFSEGAGLAPSSSE